ncbi:MAG: hypothetical protein H0Z34_14525 [Brevibacillus sp.]|nr:hypothetical protein [Brevibacillus sp.]
MLSALRNRFDYIFIDYGSCAPETETLHQLLKESDCTMFLPGLTLSAYMVHPVG